MKNQAYNSICEDEFDQKIPLHNDDTFRHGIEFQIKFIGSLEVPKPTSRTEIISSMRRIRYEFKARDVKKRSVNLSISTDGIKVSIRKKNQKNRHYNSIRTTLFQYPIHRVFYVSHDSQDLKIFSFIARDNTNNTFRCHVFKADKKNEAIHIVRTIGQSFDVCHKLSQQSSIINNNQSECDLSNSLTNQCQIPSSCESILKHQMQFMQEQFQQIQNESEITFNQIKLLKEQLNIEITARIDAQNKTKQIIERNRDLLKHIQQLLNYTHELEMKLNENNHRDSSSDSGKGKEISTESISEPIISNNPDQELTNISNNNHNHSSSILINEKNILNINHSKEYSSSSNSCSSINQNPVENYLYDHIQSIKTSSLTNSSFTECSFQTIEKD